MTSEPLAVTQREAANLLSLSERTVFALRQSGKLASIKVGTGGKSKVLIPVAAIHAFLATACSMPTTNEVVK